MEAYPCQAHKNNHCCTKNKLIGHQLNKTVKVAWSGLKWGIVFHMDEDEMGLNFVRWPKNERMAKKWGNFWHVAKNAGCGLKWGLLLHMDEVKWGYILSGGPKSTSGSKARQLHMGEVKMRLN